MIPVYEPKIGERERELVANAMETGWLSPAGEYVDEFEDLFATFVGAEHAISTMSGTAALHLALAAAGIGPGDEVIVPDSTWIACANVVTYVGAKPVFVDVDPETFTLDPLGVDRVVSEDTAAIMAVHLYGHPCDLDPLINIAERYDLLLIEDCAEAHGAAYRGQRVGSIGDVGCFSFYGNKLLTTGQGGMVVTDDNDLADRLRLLNRDGMSSRRKYYHEVVGFNYRMTNLQAAVGIGQIERADAVIEQKHTIAAWYHERLADTSLQTAVERPWADSVFWLNTVVFPTPDRRSKAISGLSDANVETRPFFYPIHEQPPYVNARHGPLSVSREIYNRGLALPSSPTLSRDEVDFVCDVLERSE